jgi:hypothetical protein
MMDSKKMEPQKTKENKSEINNFLFKDPLSSFVSFVVLKYSPNFNRVTYI